MFLILDTNLWAARSCAPNSMPGGTVLKLVGTSKFKVTIFIKKEAKSLQCSPFSKKGYQGKPLLCQSWLGQILTVPICSVGPKLTYLAPSKRRAQKTHLLFSFLFIFVNFFVFMFWQKIKQSKGRCAF